MRGSKLIGEYSYMHPEKRVSLVERGIESDVVENPKMKEALMEVENVLGFIFSTGWNRTQDPIPLSSSDVDNMLGEERESSLESGSRHSEGSLTEGEQVEIIDGAFQGNMATVQKIDFNKKRIEVSIRIFKKDTKVELSYNQVKRK